MNAQRGCTRPATGRGRPCCASRQRKARGTHSRARLCFFLSDTRDQRYVHHDSPSVKSKLTACLACWRLAYRRRHATRCAKNSVPERGRPCLRAWSRACAAPSRDCAARACSSRTRGNSQSSFSPRASRLSSKSNCRARPTRRGCTDRASPTQQECEVALGTRMDVRPARAAARPSRRRTGTHRAPCP